MDVQYFFGRYVVGNIEAEVGRYLPACPLHTYIHTYVYTYMDVCTVVV